MGTLAKIRRLHLREGVPIKEIERRTGIARNTIKSWLRRGQMVEPKYPARVMATKLDGFTEQLATWLKADAHRGKRERRTVKLMYEELAAQGYRGGYGRVAAFARRWRESQAGSANKGAYVPLKFVLGEAFQFDWSTEYAFVGGLRRRLEVAHTKLCASRAFWLVAYPTQSHEMLFDAHARAFAAFGGVPQRGIYDNMKTAVDKVGLGKKRVINARFEAMTGHYLFEPEFCNVASGWEKGIVEKNVRDRRSSIWHKAVKLRWDSMETLNAWLAEECRSAWSELNHPEWPALKVADVLQDEQTRLMPNPKPFDGYVEMPARVSSTALVHLQRILPAAVGLSRAKALLLLGEPFDAQNATDWGLVWKVVEDVELDAASWQLATVLAKLEPAVAAQFKIVLNNLGLPAFDQAIAEESRAQRALLAAKVTQAQIRPASP